MPHHLVVLLAAATAPGEASGASIGSDLAVWLGIVAVLLLLGATLVLVARRRRADVDA